MKMYTVTLRYTPSTQSPSLNLTASSIELYLEEFQCTKWIWNNTDYVKYFGN